MNKPVQEEKEQEQSNSSTKQEQKERNYNTIYHPTPGYYSSINFKQQITPPVNQNAQQQQVQPQNQNIQQSPANKNSQTMVRQEFPNGEKTAIDYTQSKINISQVLKDFKSTTEAIGSPDNIKETVYTYISLVKQESEKDNPNKKIIQSNLKNASQVLDEYITDTLKKPSNVVEGWIDSLFLQKVDYKYDANVVNPDFEIKLPKKNEQKEDAVASQPVEATSQASNQTEQTQYLVGNKDAENPFFVSLISAKKEKNPAEALNMYEEIIKEATNSNDSRALSIAYFESGKLYDSFNSLTKAVENYSSAIECSNDDGLKAQAYMKMAQIQHDNADLKVAGENYISSIAYFGQVDNPKAQAVLLSQTGKLASETYDKENAATLFRIANSLAGDLNDKNLQGKINQKAGDAFDYMNEPKQALDYYKTSAASYDEIANNLELAKDYQAAAKLMLELGNPAKAKTLLQKAFKASAKTDNQDLMQNIQAQIAVLSA